LFNSYLAAPDNKSNNSFQFSLSCQTARNCHSVENADVISFSLAGAELIICTRDVQKVRRL